MRRPLIISDCDEVLLHMVSHFRDWLEESHGVAFDMNTGNFGRALRWKESGEPLQPKEIWTFLGRFFDDEMERQTVIEGAAAALEALASHADIVVLTNLEDARQIQRADQLARHGIQVPVYTNQGPKGPAIEAIIREYQPSSAIFIDDLAQHHQSAAESVPSIGRLHFCGEPLIAPHIDCAHEAGHAHARIDQWDKALPWLIAKLEENKKS